MEIKNLVKKLRELDKKYASESVVYNAEKAVLSVDILQHGEEIFQKLKENPDNFLSIESKFFKDAAFVADALEIADVSAKKVSKDYANRTHRSLVEEKRKDVRVEMHDKKDLYNTAYESFKYRFVLKFESVGKDFQQEDEKLEQSPAYQKELARYYCLAVLRENLSGKPEEEEFLAKYDKTSKSMEKDKK